MVTDRIKEDNNHLLLIDDQTSFKNESSYLVQNIKEGTLGSYCLMKSPEPYNKRDSQEKVMTEQSCSPLFRLILPSQIKAHVIANDTELFSQFTSTPYEKAM